MFSFEYVLMKNFFEEFDVKKQQYQNLVLLKVHLVFLCNIFKLIRRIFADVTYELRILQRLTLFAMISVSFKSQELILFVFYYNKIIDILCDVHIVSVFSQSILCHFLFDISTSQTQFEGSFTVSKLIFLFYFLRVILNILNNFFLVFE